jgi:hypothetical protein
MFTTGLRAGDLAMTGIAGLRPIGQVMGACVLHSDSLYENVTITGSPGASRSRARNDAGMTGTVTGD